MSITAPAAPHGTGSPTRTQRLGGLAMTGALLLLCTSGLVVTSIQAHPHAPLAAVAPIGR